MFLCVCLRVFGCVYVYVHRSKKRVLGPLYLKLQEVMSHLSLYAAEGGLEFLIVLPLSLSLLEYSCVSPCLAFLGCFEGLVYVSSQTSKRLF